MRTEAEHWHLHWLSANTIGEGAESIMRSERQVSQEIREVAPFVAEEQRQLAKVFMGLFMASCSV